MTLHADDSPVNHRGAVVQVRPWPDAAARAAVVYVGRAAFGWPASAWGNPHRPATRGCPAALAECLRAYRAGLAALPDLDDRLAALWAATGRGRLPLGCWCAPGLPCHAGVLVDLLVERFATEGRR